MPTDAIELKASEQLLPEVEPIVADLFSRIKRLLNGAELHHIGATSVPGSLTKGDIDILLRAAAPDFERVKAVLSVNFKIKQPVNWTADFASFGDDSYGLSVGIQLVAQGSVSDFFLFERDYLRAHPESLAEYNRIKTEHAGRGAAAYWKAKDSFLSKIVALWSRESSGAAQVPEAASDPGPNPWESGRP